MIKVGGICQLLQLPPTAYPWF